MAEAKKKTTRKSEKTKESLDAVLTEDLRIQKNLTHSIENLDISIKNLADLLKRIDEHEYLSMHKSTWKVIIHNIFLGILFAIGTVLGLVLLSWLTFNFFKDSVILKNIVENQLKMRQLDLNEIREKARIDIRRDKSMSGSTEKSN